jgi:hypothetical protein
MGKSDETNSLGEAFLSGIDVSKKLSEASPDFPREIWHLIELVEQKLSFDKPYRISFHPRNYQSHSFIGTIEAFENEAHIYYDRDRNVCWRRFIVAKEMCHLLFASFGEKHLASTPDQIEQLINKIMAGLEKIDLSSDHKASTESCTIFMALEVLLPHSERPKIEKILTSGGQILDVATLYRVPSQIVRAYLSPEYAKLMTQSYCVSGMGAK